MLALGNPLHAFDYATLAESRIVVRRAKKGEELRTLDGELRKLDPDDLLIADAKRAIALAGIMGGEETEIAEATTDVLLEAANFDPYTIFRTSERLRLRTEGSNRWEKGVDPYLAPVAATMATELHRRADGCALGRPRGRARAIARAPGDQLPARTRRRGDRDRDAPRGAACTPAQARLRRGG